MKKLERKGFTVIEVVLVLAIAGLIFAMAFIALPALQRNQRDAQRRDDMATFVDALKKFQTNNRGALPTYNNSNTHGSSVKNVQVMRDRVDYSSTSDGVEWKDFYRNYLKESFMDPSGVGYNLIVEPECRKPSDVHNPINKDECQYSATMNYNASNHANIWALSFTNHYILVEIGATCDGSHAIKSNNPRKVAVMYAMEGPGVYCTST